MRERVRITARARGSHRIFTAKNAKNAKTAKNIAMAIAVSSQWDADQHG